MGRRSKYSPEVKERAVPMVLTNSISTNRSGRLSHHLSALKFVLFLPFIGGALVGASDQKMVGRRVSVRHLA